MVKNGNRSLAGGRAGSGVAARASTAAQDGGEEVGATVAAVIQTQTANTTQWAAVLPVATERADMRLQWIARLLANPLLDSALLMEPYARHRLSAASAHGQVIALSMDQTDLGDRFAILMVSVRVGERALPLVWRVEAGAANLGFAAQRALLEIVAGWLPAGAAVLLAADRFYPSAPLIQWLQARAWGYRLRLKGNHVVDVGRSEIATTADLARGTAPAGEVGARLFEAGITTHIGVWHETGHDEPWIIAMDCPPTPAAVRDYGLRWGIEPMFCDFKSRGFGLEDTQLRSAIRVDHLVLIMTLAMYWCTDTGWRDAQETPTALEKKPPRRAIPTTGASANSPAPASPGFNAGCANCCASPRSDVRSLPSGHQGKSDRW